MARTSGALALIGAACLLAGCSGSGSSGSGSSTNPEPVDPTASVADSSWQADAPEDAVSGFYADLAAGDVVAACGWWTPRYAETSVEDWNVGDYGRQVRSCPDLLSAVLDVLAIVGDPAEQLEVTDVTSETVDATHARVDVTLASADEPETYLLTRTADGWRISGDEAGDLGPG